MFFICLYTEILNTITQVKLKALSLKVLVFILFLRQKTRWGKTQGWWAMLIAGKLCGNVRVCVHDKVLNIGHLPVDFLVYRPWTPNWFLSARPIPASKKFEVNLGDDFFRLKVIFYSKHLRNLLFFFFFPAGDMKILMGSKSPHQR